MPTDTQRLLGNRAVGTVRSVVRSVCFATLLLAATVDGRLRHAFGLLHVGPEGAIWIHRWCRRIVRCLGIHCSVEGGFPGHVARSGLGFEAVVCNHLSYADILLMSAERPFVMVAKTEVRSWPLLGWLTAQAGTVYVDRGGKPETYPAVNAAMARAYRSGLPVLFFPEGTTTDGSEVLPFRRGLFYSVLHDAVQVRTAAIHYALDSDDCDATAANDVCWWGDAEFVPHVFRFLGLSGVRVAVRFGPMVEGADRFTLAENAQAVVSTMYAELELHSASESGPFSTGLCGCGMRPVWRSRSNICSTDQSSASVPSTVMDARAADGTT
jgi:lyso-ornithine lipid O-acyltransferase